MTRRRCYTAAPFDRQALIRRRAAWLEANGYIANPAWLSEDPAEDGDPVVCATRDLADMRGRAPIGAGYGAGLAARALGAKVGEENHALSTAEMPAHRHNIHNNWSAGTMAGFAVMFSLGTTDPNTSDNAGGNAAHNTMQPSIALNFIVKT